MVDKLNTGASLFASCLVNHGVEYIFGIPGAKINDLFDALEDTPIEVILCRHEQNAALMAASYGRITGRPGVVMVTSGPGVSNLATGLLTATTEGDPIVAIGGNVPRSMRYKESHQCADNIKLLEATTKYAVECISVETIPEVIANAFREATENRQGASFISLPQDILLEPVSLKAPNALSDVMPVMATMSQIQSIADQISTAKKPVFFLGEEASLPQVSRELRSLLAHHAIACVGTYQSAGVISRDLVHLFAGRVGLFQNQPGDQLINQSDLIITVGFNPVEYDPEIWNKDQSKTIIHIGDKRCDVHTTYMPVIECLGNMALNLELLTKCLPKLKYSKQKEVVDIFRKELDKDLDSATSCSGMPIHPLRFIHDLRLCIDDKTTVTCDVGSHYIWVARYLLSYEARHLLFSNGQQTLGVALPWAIGAHFAGRKEPIISISGDGGFLFSAMELETAVRVGANIIHFIWRDGAYNMVKEVQLMNYQRESAVEFGKVDTVLFAESFGAHGLRLEDADQLPDILEEAKLLGGPVLVDVPIDYSDNHILFEKLHSHIGN